MVDWLRELHATGALMDATDPKFGGQYVEAEMERVPKIGLLSRDRQPKCRFGLRQVLEILEEEFPILEFDYLFYLVMT